MCQLKKGAHVLNHSDIITQDVRDITDVDHDNDAVARRDFARFYALQKIQTYAKQKNQKKLVHGKIPWDPESDHECAVCVGDVSDGLLVIDVDQKNHGQTTIRKSGHAYLERVGITLPDTYTVQTQSGEGRHYYYRVIDERARALLREIKNPKYYAVDNDVDSSAVELFYADGRWVFAPPSSGYRVCNDVAIGLLTYDDVCALLQRKQSHQQTAASRTSPHNTLHATQHDSAKHYLLTAQAAVQGQSGDATLYAVTVGLLSRYGTQLSDDDAIILLHNVYNPRCVPPWGVDARRVMAHKVACARSYLRDSNVHVLSSTKQDTHDAADAVSASPHTTTILQDNTDTSIAEYYMRTAYADRSIVVSTGASLYAYNQRKGIYDEVTALTVQSDMRDLERKLYAPNDRGQNTIIKINKSRTESIVHRVLFDKKMYDANFLCAQKNSSKTYTAFSNTTVLCDIKDKFLSFLAHSPDFKLISSYDYDISQHDDVRVFDACPKFEKFLYEVFENDTQAFAKMKVLQEFFGACLFGIATHYQKMLGLVGGGSNGKSVLLKTIREGVFRGNKIASVPLQKFHNARSLHALVGARINIVTELPSMELAESSAVKSIIDGDIATAEQKYVNEFLFAPVAGHVFAVNNLPSMQDNSHGFWRRMLIVEFPNTFSAANAVRGLELELADERSGIARWALFGARRLLQAGTYTHLDTSAAEEQCKLESDSVYAFFVDALTVDASCQNTATTIYNAYRDYCDSNGRKATSIQRMSRRLAELGVSRVKGRHHNLLMCALIGDF